MQITNDVSQAVAAATGATSSPSTPSTGSTGSTSSSSSSNSVNGIVSEQTFLQLLVAQIQNQDPLSPTDSMDFVTQLAQFSSLEQLININQGVGTLDSDLTPTSTTNPTGTTG